jgi:hypothetical protein
MSSYVQEMEREVQELRQENRDLEAKAMHVGDTEDIFTFKGQRYFSVSQVEVPVDLMVRAMYGINHQAGREILRAVQAALTEEQKTLLENMTTLDFKDQAAVLAESTVLVEQPYGGTTLYQIAELIKKNEEVLRQ